MRACEYVCNLYNLYLALVLKALVLALVLKALALKS
jgi:hypothetical protein